MTIERTGVRLSIVQQLERNRAFRGRPLALEFRDPLSGRLLRASEVLGSGAEGIGGVIASAATRLDVIMPEMVTNVRFSFDISFNIMKNPVTVKMFRQFVEDNGYEIVGHNADKLIALLADPNKSGHALTFVSYEDATAFVQWRKEKTGQDLRMPTEDEWLTIIKGVGDQLSGGLWEWTQTIRRGVAKVLRSLSHFYQSGYHPDVRDIDATFRLVELVEDKK